ncbi:MAG TPA: hypothetical protein VNH44_11920 [Micropepsaceae bacterium]|nr:hypothetical protein [Micropepsaceae bacterium]
MAYQTSAQARIAELYDEAAQARELASKFNDAATRNDLVNYAAALEAVAADWERAILSNAKGEPPDWQKSSPRPGDRTPPPHRHLQIWGNFRRGYRM